jgi:hypothetical protein
VTVLGTEIVLCTALTSRKIVGTAAPSGTKPSTAPAGTPAQGAGAGRAPGAVSLVSSAA